MTNKKYYKHYRFTNEAAAANVISLNNFSPRCLSIKSFILLDPGVKTK